MTATVEPIRALRKYLVAETTMPRLYLEELPSSLTNEMPVEVALLRSSGGGIMGNANRFGDLRVDLICYGKTQSLARRTYSQYRMALKSLDRVAVTDGTSNGRVLLHWARIASDGVTGLDPMTNWPVCASSWQLLTSDVVTT